MIQKNINLQNIYKIALLGIQRAYVFMGLGFRASSMEELSSFNLTDAVQLQLLPNTDDPKTIKHYKDEFRTWVVSCALREAIEAYAIFLDRVYDLFSVIDAAQGRKTLEEHEKRQKPFEKKGLTDKLEQLAKDYGIESPFSEEIETFRVARNCLAHRTGIVSKNSGDCNSGDFLEVKWRSINTFIELNDGRLFSLNDVIRTDGIKPGADATWQILHASRRKAFPAGKQVNFAPQDLAEILWTMQWALDITWKQIHSKVMASGIPLQENGKPTT